MPVSTRTRGWQASGERRPLSGPSLLTQRVFRSGDALAVRGFAWSFGVRAGIASPRLADLVLAVNEATACAGRAPCRARVRLWMTGRRAFCQVYGDVRQLGGSACCGPGNDQAPCNDQVEALRRMLLRRLSDYVSVSSGPQGVTVMLSMTVV